MKTLLVILCGWSVAAALAADVYQPDPDHTFAWFEFNHAGYSLQRDRFDKVNASVSLDLQNQTGSVEASVDVNSINTGSSRFNQVLLSDAFFDVARFPVMTFKSSRFSFDRLDNVTAVEGDLTIKGITRPVTLSVTHYKCMMHPMLHRLVCGLNATARVSRSDFNLGKYVPLVSNDITLYVSIEAIQQ
ncbi:MAG: YceI family protein [Rhodoferax sp.]|nr:YceI family protein [Rhodoferax sp.]